MPSQQVTPTSFTIEQRQVNAGGVPFPFVCFVVNHTEMTIDPTQAVNMSSLLDLVPSGTLKDQLSAMGLVAVCSTCKIQGSTSTDTGEAGYYGTGNVRVRKYVSGSNTGARLVIGNDEEGLWNPSNSNSNPWRNFIYFHAYIYFPQDDLYFPFAGAIRTFWKDPGSNMGIVDFSSVPYATVTKGDYDSGMALTLSLTNASTTTALNDFLHTSKGLPTDPYDNLPVGGDTPIPGGGTVAIPGLPGLTASSAGVIGLFVPSAGQMQSLADFMWTDFGGTGTTVEDILKEVVEALKRSISNPLDYIIGLNIIPSQGLSIGASKVVRFGFISSGVSMPVLSNQYFTVDCGSLAFDTLCGDTFLDYAPYSKFSLYLPYIGFKDVDPNDFVGHTIGVVYHGDCVTGGVTAYVTKDGSVMYQYSGCCALNVPLSADNWGETISAAVNVATGIVAAAASGGAAGVALGAAKGAASVAANPSLLSPQVSHSGAVSGGAGCMGVQYPFVIREAVNFHSTNGFNKSSGYPAYYYKKFSEVSGYTVVLDAHMSNIIGATQNEIDEIERLLESGVIL